MNKNNLIKTISDFGLSDNESRVYIASLSLGATSILKLSKEANIKRTTTYSVVESLKQRGLMLIEQKGWKQYYVAQSPEKLKSIIESKKKKLQTGLPYLMSLYNMKGHDSLIKYYEGLEAIKSAYESMIKDVKSHQDYLVLSDASKWLNLDKQYFINFSKRRARLNINIKMLLQNNSEAKEILKREIELNAQIKLLPKQINLNTNLVVTPQRALVHQLVPPIMAISVENPNIIAMYKEMFEVMWGSNK
jgi:sugar-specific transcriptional regulator TrmB